MQVTLISHTEAPTINCALAAKTCTSVSPWEECDPDKLLKRVLDMGHESIAEHASFTFLIEGISRTCSHQLVRYRHASFAQQSQRYVEGMPDIVVPESIREDEGAHNEYQIALDHIKYSYDKIIEFGIPPEDARYILPNAACTNITITVNAAELRHMARQRLCNRAQWEIRNLVTIMGNLVNEIAPELMRGVGPACLKGECPEGKLSCGKPWKG